MKKTFKRGFTLVELLVVISIIGLLAGLMLPAINSAREQGRRATCINNQKNIALAFTMFEQNKGRYPQYRTLSDSHALSNDQGMQTYNNVYSQLPDGTVASHMGWIPQLFPFVEQPQLYEEINKYGYTSQCDVALELFFCKSAGSIEKNANNYVGNCGLADIAVDTTGAYGLLTDGVGSTINGQSYLGKTMSADEVKDGLSNTLLLSENLQAGTIWSSKEYLVGFCVNANTDNGVNESNAPIPFFNESATSYQDNPGYPLKPNLFRDEAEGYASANGSSDSAVYWNTARMSSSHPGVVVAAMADGSTRVVSENVDAEVLTKAMAPNDKATAFWPQFKTRTFDASLLND